MFIQNVYIIGKHFVLTSPWTPRRSEEIHKLQSDASDITDLYLNFLLWQLSPWHDIPNPHCHCVHVHSRWEHERGWICFKPYLLNSEEKSTSYEDEDNGEVENPCLPGHHNPPIAVKFIPTREDLPLPPLWGPFLERGLHRCRAASAYLAVLALSHGLWHPEMHQLLINPGADVPVWREEAGSVYRPRSQRCRPMPERREGGKTKFVEKVQATLPDITHISLTLTLHECSFVRANLVSS